MQFITHHPLMELGDAGHGTSFAADVFMGRPAICDIQKFEPRMVACRAEILSMLGRKNNQLASLDLIVDARGLFLIAIFRVAMNTGNAKSAMSNLLRHIQPEHQQSVQQTMRPFDDLDRLRVLAMETPTTLRPCDTVDASPKDPPQQPYAWWSKTGFVYAKEETPPQPRAWRSIEEFELALDETPPPPLVLQGQTLCLDDIAFEGFETTGLLSRWIADVQEVGAISILNIGSAKLQYYRCIYESRRRELLKWRFGTDSPLPMIVERALEYEATGALPSHTDSPKKKCVFMHRCRAVYQELSPERPVPPLENRQVAVLMGDAVTCDDCASTKSSICYEWDHRFGAWTAHGVSKGIYNPVIPGVTDVICPADERSLCAACAAKTFYTCQECRRSDLNIMNRWCECGGQVVGRLPKGTPPGPREMSAILDQILRSSANYSHFDYNRYEQDAHEDLDEDLDELAMEVKRMRV
jgi:hypothetical protein